MNHRTERIWLSALVVLLGITGPSSVDAQARNDTIRVSITAKVVNAVTLEGLSGAVVRVPLLDFAAMTDDRGEFTMDSVPTGEYTVVVSRTGFRPSKGTLLLENHGDLVFHLLPEEQVVSGRGSEIRGRVVDQESGDPLGNAMVRIPDLGLGQMSNERGWFSFTSVPLGSHVISVESLGYASKSDTVLLGQGQLLDMTVSLSADPIQLEGITVTSRPRWLTATGFFRRQERGNALSGRQWTREEIEARNVVFVQDILTSAPGIQMRAGRDGKSRLVGRRGCPLDFYVDDYHIPDFKIETLDPDWIEAMEVYNGHSTFMPPEYSHCGVVLIWLKRGGR